MWVLTNNSTGNVLIVISEKSKYTVGRVGADLVITDDSSISRTHAFLHITTKIDRGKGDLTKELLELEDAGSKYGTFHNFNIEKGAVIPKHKRITLEDGDRIRFGVLKNVWTVSNKTPIVAVSALPEEITNQLTQILPILGGSILPAFEESYTHLTLKEINVTSKLLHALLDKKPIVTCDYWCNLVQAARRGRRLLPQVTSYMPPNPHNFDIEYREARKTVFKNLTFVFLHARHFKTYAGLVEKAGGTSKHLNVGIQKSFLIRNDVVVVHYVPSTESQSSQTISTIEDYLKLHSRRTVPEYEIAMAILSCSTTRYCNPSYKIDEETLQINGPNDTVVLQSAVQTISSNTNLSESLEEAETQVFIPETDRRSTASTHLTDKSSIYLPTSVVDQANSIESQIFETSNKQVTNSAEKAMSSLQVTESVQEVNKRKRTRGKQPGTSTLINAEMDSDENELFNFAAKKAHIDEMRVSPVRRETRQQRKSHCSPLDKNAPKSAAAIPKQTPKSCDKQLPIAINKRTTRKTMINMSGFLEKSQAPIHNLPDADEQTNTVKSSVQKGIKRARVAILDNSDDDDLFCFGGKSHTNEESNKAKRVRPADDGCDSDEDLFNFGDVDADEHNGITDGIDGEYSKESISNKEKVTPMVMPKPKPLPAKICVADWLDCSLSALSIKSEQVKGALDTEKKENNDSGVEGDSKEIAEPIKGGCVVTVLSTKALIHERESGKSKTVMQHEYAKELNKTTKNFKKFSKKFHPQNRRVIRTVSSTIGGALI